MPLYAGRKAMSLIIKLLAVNLCSPGTGPGEAGNIFWDVYKDQGIALGNNMRPALERRHMKKTKVIRFQSNIPVFHHSRDQKIKI